ncbi:hypothetical protein GCM10010399_82710 [Dactylosporangium fulvum]|uniref:Uncharacterized protein n=1 Tax=Dactylosporangium fulvum TaxID=53359 RepID=A0ABY5WAY6_9ACTN|nr:hypothetical protein [Dactylosporangium fulvum]UWP85858.1 hypothetical protein Dfulv_17065 [Dactylosporangium fulvum]
MTTIAQVTLHDRWLTVDSTIALPDGPVRLGDVRHAAEMVSWTGVPGRLPWQAIMVVCNAAGWKPSGEPWGWLPRDEDPADRDVLEVPVEPVGALAPGLIL